MIGCSSLHENGEVAAHLQQPPWVMACRSLLRRAGGGRLWVLDTCSETWRCRLLR